MKREDAENIKNMPTADEMREAGIGGAPITRVHIQPAWLQMASIGPKHAKALGCASGGSARWFCAAMRD
eukprot:5611004-Amphidinium_carterae.1